MTKRIVFAIDVREIIAKPLFMRAITVKRIRRRDSSWVWIIEVDSSKKVIGFTTRGWIPKGTPNNAIRDARSRFINTIKNIGYNRESVMNKKWI